jgi:hypothetical protein
MGRVPACAPAEERPLAELGAGAVALAVLGDIGGAGPGRIQPWDDRAVGPLHLRIDRGAQAPQREAGVQGVAEATLQRLMARTRRPD